MTAYVNPSTFQPYLFGVKVAGTAKAVPQNATQTLFTVSGGRIAVTSLFGVVTVIMAGTTPNCKFTSTPTTGTAVDLTTTTSLGTTEVGGHVTIGSFGAATVVKNAGAANLLSAPIIVPIGTIGVNVSAADATGSIQWTLTYVPLDAGASVVAN
jgi:hypothetical protein